MTGFEQASHAAQIGPSHRGTEGGIPDVKGATLVAPLHSVATDYLVDFKNISLVSHSTPVIFCRKVAVAPRPGS
jgi:hypothetical protein